MLALYGPLASWGTTAPGTTRNSLDHPTRSAILGLVAAAMGIRNDDDDAHRALESGYGTAVRVDALGPVLRDYHTAQTTRARGQRRLATRRTELSYDREDVETILTRRDYRSDSLWTAALWAHEEAPFPLRTLQDALERPRFVPYLGRKSCPLALPMHPRVVEAPTLRGALAAYSCPHPAFLPELEDAAGATLERPVVYWSDHPSAGLTAENEWTSRDRILSRARRTFAARTVLETRHGVPPMALAEGVLPSS